MQTVTFLVGLPGSGKSYFANQVINEEMRLINGSARYRDRQASIIVDDPKNFNQDVKPHLDQGWSVYIADHTLCDENYRIKAEDLFLRLYPQIMLKWLFFENEPARCMRNVQYRTIRGDNREVFATIERYAAIYTIPEGATVAPVCEAGIGDEV